MVVKNMYDIKKNTHREARDVCPSFLPKSLTSQGRITESFWRTVTICPLLSMTGLLLAGFSIVFLFDSEPKEWSVSKNESRGESCFMETVDEEDDVEGLPPPSRLLISLPICKWVVDREEGGGDAWIDASLVLRVIPVETESRSQVKCTFNYLFKPREKRAKRHRCQNHKQCKYNACNRICWVIIQRVVSSVMFPAWKIIRLQN